MTSPEGLIAEAAVGLAALLPASMVTALADAIAAANSAQWPSARDRVLQDVPHGPYRRHVAGFLDLWRSQASSVAPTAVAMALTTAAQAESAHRAAQSVELVWTGPDVEVVPLRRTEQALLQVVRSAQERLLVVSYAVYRISRVCDGLVEAADRGVDIRLVLETPHRVEGRDAYDTVKALGGAVAARCDVCMWPAEKREADADGRCGILHVKAAVADGRLLFLSSANLTEYAFTLNMELGVLITGGRLPGDEERHFDRLVEAGELVPVGME